MPVVPVESIVNKYRTSWQQLTEIQQQSICQRFGLKYTNSNDENLIKQVAEDQQAEIIRNKLLRKQARAIVECKSAPNAHRGNNLNEPDALLKKMKQILK